MTNPNFVPARALVLAAGRGERMRPLTDTTPKPLLSVRGTPLLSSHLIALLHAGHQGVVINTAWLEECITRQYGDRFSAPGSGSRALSIQYSCEGRDFGGALETAGGIVRVLPLLDFAFWAVAGDIYIPGFDFSAEVFERFCASRFLAHLFFVPNPSHHPAGDFGLSEDGLALHLKPGDSRPTYTYASIGVFKKAFFEAPHCPIPTANPSGIKAALAPLLRSVMDLGLVSAELLKGNWTDVGTPERLAALNSEYS